MFNIIPENESVYNTLPDRFNLSEYLLSINSKHLNKIAFITKTGSYTYSKIDSTVKECAFLYQKEGIQSGDRIALILHDSLEFIIAFLGALASGVIPVLINPKLGREIIYEILNDCDPSLLLISSELKQNIFKGEEVHFRLIETDDFFEILPKLSVSFSFYKSHKKELAFIAYTSGSTGEPKGVMHAHYSPIVACVNYAVKTLNLSNEDYFLSAPPLAFTYGLGTSLYMPMYLGATCILCQNKDAFSLIDAINKFHPTVFFGVPSHYASILSVRTINPIKTYNIRLCVSAGERLSEMLWHRWYHYTNIKICEGVGTTESTHIFISNRPETALPASVGKVVYGYSINLINVESVQTDTIQFGKMHLEGEGVMLGYWKKPSATNEALVNGGLQCSDLYRKDSKGYYYFVGREDQLIKVHGMWIFPPEIEEIALQLDYVSKAVLTSIPSLILDDMPDLLLFLEVEKELLMDKNILNDVKSHLKNRLPKHKVPKKIHFLSEFPLSATSKVNLKQLISDFLNKEVSCEVY